MKEQPKIETNGSQIFNVPNTEEGRNWMQNAAKYLNRPQYNMKKRGRGSEGRERRNGRLTYNGQSDCKLENADWIALYIHDGSTKANPLDAQLADAEESRRNAEWLAAQLKEQLDIALDRAEEWKAKAQSFNAQASTLTKQLCEKTKVSQVKACLPTMTLPLQDGSKVKVVGATKIEAE
jgi:hypothetical protein